jgi:DNA-binding IclR family transcriptional regulator
MGKASTSKPAPAPARVNGIQVIARAASILRALESEPDGLTLAQLTERVGLARSTTHRIIVALQHERLLSPTAANGRYRLGPALGRLGAVARGDLRHRARPHIEDLSRRTQETVDLGMLDGDQVLFVDQVQMLHRLVAVSAVGGLLPAHCTASGKALLAATRQQGALRLPTSLERFTDTTITDPAELEAELDRIIESSVAFDREEHTRGICGVAAGVRSLNGEVAAVGIPVPFTRFYGAEDRLAREVLTTARAIEADLAAHFV